MFKVLITLRTEIKKWVKSDRFFQDQQKDWIEDRRQKSWTLPNINKLYWRNHVSQSLKNFFRRVKENKNQVFQSLKDSQY